jgi:hypothetical protein
MPIFILVIQLFILGLFLVHDLFKQTERQESVKSWEMWETKITQKLFYLS